MTANRDTSVAKRVLLRSLKRVAALSRDLDGEVQLYGRVKTSHSASKKRLRNKLVAQVVLDLIGIRAVTEYVHDCYRLIRRIHLEFPVLASEFDDYIAAPKPNGYRSLHTTVLSPCGLPIEIQVRTRAMHAHAEDGSASHIRYKRLQDDEHNHG